MSINPAPRPDSVVVTLSDRSGLAAGRLVQIMLQRQYTLTIVSAALFAFFSLFANYFFTLANIYDMLRVISYTLIVGVPMTFLFISGEIDLSVGANEGFTTVVMALLITNSGVDPWIAAAASVLLGAFIGGINGLFTVIGVPSFIVTLGMLSLLRSLALVLTGATPVVYPDGVQGSFFPAVNGTIAQLDRLPVPILWGLGVAVIGAVALRYTRFGSHVYATGGNARAARATGIGTKRVKFMCFVLTGASCGLLGALEGGWLREGNPTSGTGFELQVIAALIIGGITLTGGAGSVYGTFIGASIVGMLYNGLVLIGVEGNWNGFFVGLLIVVVASAEIGLQRRHELRRFIQSLDVRRVRGRPNGKGIRR
jgi:ribose transport system permease protein